MVSMKRLTKEQRARILHLPLRGSVDPGGDSLNWGEQKN
jgi:hypothetical protein